MTAFRLAPGPLLVAYEQSCSRLDRLGFADALWARRLDVWTADISTQQKIANRLGWLGAVDFVAPHVPRLQRLAESIRSEGFTDVVLLGMGGSSLAPEVLRQALTLADGYPRFRMLDSVDPDAVRGAMDRAASSLFLLASKSGSTIEPNVLAAEAGRRLAASGHARWGSRFIAITDENTVLHRRAVDEGFREVFLNPADIGGRYSALSLFGMVPAALMGADVDGLLEGARRMEAACRVPAAAGNAGLALGALMAAGARTGRDKLTVLLPDRLQPFGLWIEQLVAESTGKHGKGIVPIVGETADSPIGSDRVFVSVTLGDETADAAHLRRVHDSGAPFVELEMPDVAAIGAEFLRWEVATAAAGLLMDINPFDEPNVQQAKDATRVLLDGYRASQRLPMAEPHASFDGCRLTLSSAAHEQLAGDSADAFLRLVQPSDYAALLVYLPPALAAFEGPVRAFRHALASGTGAATMLGYGPRYLHSTGQLHKGGANNGVFIVITARPDADLAIPGEAFSFAVLEMAQAIGDFQSLDRAGRRALHVHLPRRDAELLRRTSDALLARLPTAVARARP
jgi:glucose-6-phosphate isomerase